MKQHWKCRLWKTLWGLSALSLLLAWYSVFTKAPVFGLDPLVWFWNALIFGVLAVPVKLDCHSCTVCMPSGEK